MTSVQKVSDKTLESLGPADGYYFTFVLKVDENSEHVGGMNLFGSRFAITRRIES